MIAFEFNNDNGNRIALHADWYDEGKCFSHTLKIDGTAQGWDKTEYTFHDLFEVMYLRNALDAYIAACQKVNLFDYEEDREFGVEEDTEEKN